MKLTLIIACFFVFFSCRKTYEAPVPNTKWSLFESAPAAYPAKNVRKKMEGIYAISDPSGRFGTSAAAKWSYTANGSDTVYHFSLFLPKNVTYFICEGRRLDSSILLSGYWRTMINTETGRAQLTITKSNGAGNLLSGLNVDSLIINGNFGTGENNPDQNISFRYQRPLYGGSPFEIVAHRAGGRSSDLLPASENSVEMVKLASRFGATGIEIDVRLTSDGVPVIFHDETLNERLIQKNGMVGPIGNYSYAQLYNLVRLPHGEHIPTLREMLSTMVYNTPLTYVWLDTKLTGSLQVMRDLQIEFTQRAAAIGRTVNITIGIPTDVALGNFMRLADYQNIPSVCELDPQFVAQANSPIWGPRWTLGLQNDVVASIHAAGRKAFVWTLDVPENIDEFIRDGHFDGILSNYPSELAYYYYAKQ